MNKKVLSMILAFAMIMVQIPTSVYVLAADRDSCIDSAVVDSANSSTGWTIDDVLDLIDALPLADEVADESKIEVKIALNEALAAYSAAMGQADIDAEELRDAVGDERREKLRALSELLRDVAVTVLDSGINPQTQADFKMGRLSLMGQMLLKGSSPTGAVIGSAENPFLIGTPEVLSELGELTQNNEEYGADMPFAAANYKLVADIDLAGYDSMQRINNFKGTFDGDGHVIKNMKTAGLFATAETGSVIKNLGIEDCKVSCEGGAGGVAAYTNGTIMNCYVTGTITGTDPANSNNLGGVVGEAAANAVIINCYAAVNVSGGSCIGGVAGRAFGMVTNCYATGNVSGTGTVGGVAGVAQNATIANCYATGNISASGTVGGVVGWSLSSTVTDCAALGQTVTGNVNYGRVVGASGGTISGCYAFSGMKIGASGSEAVVTGGAADNAKGANLSYTVSNAEGAKLSAQFNAIFGSDAAWNYTADALPTLNDVDGDQSSELPAWFTSIMPTIFTISTAAQLDELRQLVNYGTASASGYTNTAESYYYLTADIDLAGSGNVTPIGKEGQPFKGAFDGNGHVIENMTVNISNRDGGLFGYTAENSVIKNVGVKNCNVTAIANAGGVVGTAHGTITNCYSTGSVKGTGQYIGGVVGDSYGTVTNCYSTASVSGPYFVGGVVGSADGNVTGCYATGNVTGTNTSTGGVVGLAQGAIANCYSTGTVIGNNYVGGVVGEANNNITNCYSTGNITANGVRAGGVVGYYHGNSITNCAALGKTVTGFINGRIAGYMESGTVSNCYAWNGMKIGESGSEATVIGGAADNKNGADYAGGNPEFSTIFNGDAAWEYMPGALPTLKDASGSQSNNLPSWIGGWSSMFAISTAAQLEELRQLVNNGTASASGYTNTAESYYYLTADIDLAESGSVTPIGLGEGVPFRGTFDGKGHAVKNMTISSSGNVGLFGYTAGHSVIKNLGVENCNVTGGDYTGGVVGAATGMVTNCYSTGSVTGDKYVGGVVGSATTGYEIEDSNPVFYTGTVTDCHSACTVSSIGSGSAYAGGVVGSTQNALTNCYATGSVSGGEYAELGGVVGSAGAVTGCYATGSVSGGNHAGGVVGHTNSTVTNCYAIGSVSGGENAYVGGVLGYLGSSTGAVTNCAALGKAATGVAASRIVGVTSGSTVSNCYAWNGMSLSGDNIGDNGTDLTYIATNAVGARLSAQFSAIFGDNAAWNYTGDALPVLAGVVGSQSSDLPDWVVLGAGTEANPHIISTAAQLNDLRKVVNDGATSAYGYTNAADRFYQLNANISLSGFDDDGNSANGNWTPIGTSSNMFLGSFDGNGYAVKQMTIQLPSTVDATGLFGITAEGSVIQNLGVENCFVTGYYNVGGVVGRANGAVTGCYTTGTIAGNNFTGGVVGFSSAADAVTRCYSTCSVNGNERVGGVVGYSINSVMGCYATGSVTGSANVGGVVGEASSAVTNCVALGKTVTGNSTSTGRVVGNYGFSPTNCYAWRSMKIGESGSRAVVTDGAVNNKNGADLLYLTEQGLLLGDVMFIWPGFAENGWDVPENQISGDYKVMPKLPYQASYPSIPAKLVQVLTLKLNYNNGTVESKNIYSEYGEITLPGKSDLAAMTVSDAKVFAGWDAQQSIAEDTAPGYQAGDQLLLAQDTTLYAQWKTVSAALDSKDAKTGYYEVASYHNTPLQNQTTLTLANNTFKAADNLDIKGWFQYPPDWLTITLTAEAGSDTATITFGGTPDSGSLNLYEPINIPTSALALPMDVEKFTSDTVHVSIYKAKPTVTWAAAAQSVTYTALEPIITAPTVTLSGADVYSGSFEYSYKTDAAGTVYTNGLPTAVGTYYVKAHIDADYHTNYSGADSDTDLKLTIAYLQTDAVAIADGTQGANGWFTSDVTLKAPEGYSIAGSNGSDASWVSSLPPINSDMFTDISYYLRKDSSGEITDIKTIAVYRDTAAPVIGTVTYSVHQSFLDWIFHKSVIRVTVPVTDMLSSVGHIRYVLVPEGGMPLAAQTVVVDADGNAVFDVEKIFKGTVYITAYDKADNASEEIASKRMAVEETAPTLSLTKDGTNAFTNNWYTSAQTLNIIAEDMGSGIQSITCSVDGGDATTLFEAKEANLALTQLKDATVPVLEGTHIYTVTVTDNALNTTVQPVTIKQDTVSPTVDSVISSNMTDTTATITAAASDATSGVKKYYLYCEEGEVPYADFDSVKATCLTSTDGAFQLTSLTRNTTYTIFVWAEDGAGNISYTCQALVKTGKAPLEGATVVLGSNFTYTGESHTPSVTVTLGGETLTAGTDYTVSYSNSNGGAGNTTSAGTVSVTVTAAESGNYTGTVTGMAYTIAPAVPTVTWSETDKAQTTTYTGSPVVITAPQVTLVNSETYSGGIQYAYKQVDGFLNGLFEGYTDGLPTEAGKYLVKAHIAANGNYTAADSTTELALTIEKADATLSIKPTYIGKTYDGTPIAGPTAAQIVSNITNPTVTYSYRLDYNGVPSSLLAYAPSYAGIYWVEGKIAETKNTKAITSDAVKFTITKAPLTIICGTVAERKWDNQATALVESITFGGLQNNESLTLGTDYIVTGAAYADAAVGNGKSVTGGTIALTPTGKANNYTFSDTTLSGKGLTGNIIKADGPAAPTFNAWDDVANTFAFNSTSTTIYEYRINSTYESDWTAITASADATQIAVGNVTIPAGGLEVRVKITGTHEAGAILTNTSAQVFTASIEGSVSFYKATGVTYGDILTAMASGHQTGAELHYQWKADGSNVGEDSATYTVQSGDIGKAITVTVTATGYNSSLTPATATNEVLKRALTVTAEAKNKTYGQTDPAFTYSMTSGSLINGDILSGALSRDAGETPNTYTINQGTLGNAAYASTYESANLTINKADVTLNVTVNPAAAKAGKTVTVTVSAVNTGSNLAAFGWSQPAGVTLTVPKNGSVALIPVAGKSGEYTASYQIPADTAVNTEFTFTAAVADTTGNYTNPQPKNAVLTVTEKSAVKLTLTADKTSGVTYGDSVVYTAKVEKNNPILDALNTLDGTVTFYFDGVKAENLLATKTISDTLAVTLDSTRLTAGEHTVYAVYSGNAEFAAATQNATTNVAARSLAWDASGLTALKKYDGDNTATVNGTLLVTGALQGTDPAFSYTSLSGTYASASAGSQTVNVAVNGAALANSNYTLPAGNPTFTGKINAVSEITNVPESGNGMAYKLKQEHGISDVPDALISNPDLNTPAKIEARMKVSIESAMNGVGTANIEIYDITLLFSTDNDQTWQTATASNFPENGVTVILPYPSGTNAADFDFVITHMFTTGANAGKTETILPTKTAEGLKFILHSLSPVAVGYKAATSNGGSGDSTDYNAEFWQSVENKINAANNGDVIKVKAQYFDKMPYTVMDALRRKSVTLVVDWSNGNTITIPAGKAQQNESGRIYWPLSKLEELYDDVTFVETPNTSGTQVNPETGGVGYIAYASTGEAVPITGSVQRVEAITVEDTVKAQAPMAATPSTEGVAASPAENKQNHTREIAAVFALFAAAIGGCWVYRRKAAGK